MVTNSSPTTPASVGGPGFTMDRSAIDSLQQQADELRTGYEEVSSKLSGQALAGNAFGSVGSFAAEAFNASNGRSVDLVGQAASMLGLVGEGLKATAQTHLDADRANGEQFTTMAPAEITQGPPGAPAAQGAPSGGAPTTQAPPVATEQPPGGSGAPIPDHTTQAPSADPVPTPQGTTGQTPPPTPDPRQNTPTTTTPQSTPAPTPPAATPPAATPPQAAPVPDFPEIPDPPPVPNGSTGGTTPPPMPPIPEAPKDLFKQPTIPDSSTSGSTGTGSGDGNPGGTGTSATTTPPPMPPIPEAPKDLFKQPTIPDLTSPSGTGASGGTGTTPPPAPPVPEVPEDLFKQPTLPDLDAGGSGGGTAGGTDPSGDAGKSPLPDDARPEPGEPSPAHDRHPSPERDEHGLPITSVDGKPCVDLRDLPAEEAERWQENLRDILATKGEGSFFWAGDTIDTEGQRHSLMDLAEFMANLDGRAEPTGRPEVSDDVTASPARSANGDVYVLVGPNRAEDGPVELADFPTLQGNPRVERVFAIDVVTGKEVQIHPKGPATETS
ncbi:hypothetical protein LZG04_38530 [Saccharothrix sp. S26]|uniref:hypothetical protein n=1 Tax=Saccharothrix sp. S26 TaxID=2907215 RepID=UPI001F2230ED|nr:hypothetical protein [Saccharothrix sp. S26]MCE7000673.1 hypothetical protein [Saccharothrix sp. S26]